VTAISANPSHLLPFPNTVLCQLTAGGVGTLGSPVPGPAGMEGRAMCRGNKVAQGLDLVMIQPFPACR